MNDEETAQLLERYNERLRTYGYSPRTLGWTKPKHRLRYKILLDYWQFTGPTATTLLDVGCGFGDLYGFATAEGLTIDYHGIDVNPDLIRIAREVYPGATFSVGDPIRDGLERQYDVIVSSGAHNHRMSESWGYVERTFAVFAQAAKRGFAVNFLSDRVNVRGPENFHARPESILELALNHSSRVQLRHDYMPFEFTIFVDRADAYSEEQTVFAGFEPWCDPVDGTS